MEVAASLQQSFDLAWFRDLPTEPVPDFASLQARPGEWVLAVNFFGLRTGSAWQDWCQRHDDVRLIEDHTHDPLSDWAMQSTAPYAFASLRKTLPLPDGAILWSPRQLPLPPPLGPVSLGAYYKLSAMILKRAYLQGAGIAKEDFRTLQVQGEEMLGQADDGAASDFTRAVWRHLPVLEFRSRRQANVQLLLASLAGRINSFCQPLFSSWSRGAAPFQAILLCASPEIREQLRQHLIQHHVYAAVHWRQGDGGLCSEDPAALDLSRRILTVPADHRYSSEDVARVAQLLTAFFSPGARPLPSPAPDPDRGLV